MELPFERSNNDAAKKCTPHIIRSANQPQLGLAKSPSMMVGSDNTANKSLTNRTNGHHTFLQRSLSVNAEAPGSGNDESSPSNSDSDSDARNSTEKAHKNKANIESVTEKVNAKVGGAVVVVPKLDDEETFEKFFASKKTSDTNSNDNQVEISDFDNIKGAER